MLDDVLIDGGADGIGDEVPAQDVGTRDPAKVYELDSRDWLWGVLLAIMSSVDLAGWGWWLRGRWVRKRLSR